MKHIGFSFLLLPAVLFNLKVPIGCVNLRSCEPFLIFTGGDAKLILI